MTVASVNSAEDVSCLSRSLAAVGLGRDSRLRRPRQTAVPEKTWLFEKPKLSFDSATPSVTSTAVGSVSEYTTANGTASDYATAVESASTTSAHEVKPWVLDEELARARARKRCSRAADLIHVYFSYGSTMTRWRVYPSTRIWRLKVRTVSFSAGNGRTQLNEQRSFAYRYARELGPDALQ